MDRFFSAMGWHLHRIARRRAKDGPALVEAVARYAAQVATQPLASRLPDLRYRLRRDGFTDELVAECFGLYCAAIGRTGGTQPDSEAVTAGRLLVHGGIVDCSDPSHRLTALALAAAAHAIYGTPVHLLTASDLRARRIATKLGPSFEALGVALAGVFAGMPPRARDVAYRSPVVCATHRDVAVAYLQDRLRLVGTSRLLVRALAGDAFGRGDQTGLLLPGLRCALVEEADSVMLDDAYAPVTISVEADQSQERLLYEQALELARACEVDTDFVFDDKGMRLTEPGAERLSRLVAPLGGVWAATQRREELVCTALAALHAYERGVDYSVAQGRVVFPKPDPGSDDSDDPDPVLRKLIELKEGGTLAATRDVLARISVPRFLRRYLHLAGVCADARGIEEDFRALYELKTTLVGASVEKADFRPRVFRSVEAKRAAVLAAVRAAQDESAAVIAVRTPREAQAVLAALEEAGIAAGMVRGSLDQGEEAVLAQLDQPGAVAVTLFPAERNVERSETAKPLRLIVAELHDARHHITHLMRAYRAASCEMLLSLDEESVASGVGAALLAVLGDTGADELSVRRADYVFRVAQFQIERARSLTRRDLMLRDEYMSGLLAFSGGRE